MSRFFRQAGDSDSESEESEEELMSSGDEAPTARPAAASTSKPLGMSRFLRRASGSSSSDSDSEDEDEDDSDEEEPEKEKEKESKKKNRFLLGAGDDDEEGSDEDVKRVVKSARDKRLDEIDATGKVIDNALKINDWVAISNGLCPLY